MSHGEVPIFVYDYRRPDVAVLPSDWLEERSTEAEERPAKAILVFHGDPEQARLSWTEPTVGLLVRVSSGGGSGVAMIDRHTARVTFEWPHPIDGGPAREVLRHFLLRLKRDFATASSVEELESAVRSAWREVSGYDDVVAALRGEGREPSREKPPRGNAFDLQRLRFEQIPLSRQNVVGAFRHSFFENEVLLRERTFVARVSDERAGRSYWQNFDSVVKSYSATMQTYVDVFPSVHCLSEYVDQLVGANEERQSFSAKWNADFPALFLATTGLEPEAAKTTLQALYGEWKAAVDALRGVCEMPGKGEVESAWHDRFVPATRALAEFLGRMPRHVLVPVVNDQAE